MKKYVWTAILTVLVLTLLYAGWLGWNYYLETRYVINGVDTRPLPHEQSDLRQKVELPQREIFPQAEADYFAGHPDALMMLTAIYDAYTKKATAEFQKQEILLAIIDNDKTNRHKMIFIAIKRLFPNAKLRCIHLSEVKNIVNTVPSITILSGKSNNTVVCWLNDMKERPPDTTAGSWLYHFEKIGDTDYLQSIGRPRE